jgi:site-specific DNA-methyltransferase (adenine-specific)
MVKGEMHMRGGPYGKAADVYGDFSRRHLTQSDEYYPRRIIKIAVERKTVHPTQKPVALMEYLIKTYTNEGNIVLDNCMGSGSTGIACGNTGRNFIGIEKDPKYFQLARERITAAQKPAKKQKSVFEGVL